MQNRNPFLVFFLSLITFGIYGIVWYVETKREMNSRGAQIPTAWLIIIPIVNIYWLWKYSEGVQLVTKERMNAGAAFVLTLLLGSIGIAIVQSAFNSSNGEGSHYTARSDSHDVHIHAAAPLGEPGSIDALAQALLTSDKPEVHFTAAQALKSIGSKDAIDTLARAFLKSDRQGVRFTTAQALRSIGSKDAMEALVQQLASIIRLGDHDDQVEAMIVMQGRFAPAFVGKQFIAEHHLISQDVQESIELHWVQGLLDELIKEDKDPHTEWFALLTLVELGDRRGEVLEGLVRRSVSYTKACDQRLKERAGQHDFALYVVANRTNDLIEETMRALAAFRGNARATQIVIGVMEGDFLRGSYFHSANSGRYLHRRYEENAICALGALGDPVAYERLEYLAARGTDSVRRCAEVALANIGQATYDEIKAKAELK